MRVRVRVRVRVSVRVRVRVREPVKTHKMVRNLLVWLLS